MRALAFAVAGLLLALVPYEAAAQDADVAILERPVARGELLSEADFAIETRPAAAARGAVSASDAAGMEARRNLMPGRIVRATDLIAPQLVRRGEPVTIRIVSGGLTIATSGRALSGGARGDMVRVVTGSTAKTLDGFVDGTGSVRVTAP